MDKDMIAVVAQVRGSSMFSLTENRIRTHRNAGFPGKQV